MKRREEADSGLRAGFIHEDEMKQMQATLPPQEEKTDKNTEAPTQEDQAKVEDKAKASQDKEVKDLPQGPQVSVQGVSGKMITGVITAVKKVKSKVSKPKDSEAEQATTPPESQLSSEEKPEQKLDQKPDQAASDQKPLEAQVQEPASSTALATSKAVAQKTEPAASEAKASQPEPETVKVKAAEPVSKPVLEPTPKADKDPELAPATQSAPQTAELKTAPKTPDQAKPLATNVKPQATTSSPKPVDQAKPASKIDQPAPKSDQAKPAAPKVKSDQGIILSAQERLARAGKTIIRPQSGNYVGKNTSTPAFKEDSYRGQRSYSGGPGGRSSYGHPQSSRPPYNKGRRTENFADKDKDEDEALRRSHSPRPKKRTMAMPDSSAFNMQKDSNRRNFKEKTQKDKDKRTSSWRSQEELELDQETVRRARRRRSRTAAQGPAPATAQLTEVKLPAAMTVKELAEILKKTGAEVITKLISFGIMATLNQEVDFDTAAIIAGEFGITAEQKVEVKEEDILFDDSEDKEEDLKPRPPVVVVMGHVDHGKTSILDWIRSSRVAAGEAGGITQHIGAYMVDVHGRKITFLDTPGHEAFTTIRARGAQVTDIAVLVVAADDGVMPQTIEAINHAKAANTEIIVAINKIDKPGANIDRVKQELATYELLDADWGGTTTMVPVSAKTGENMEELLEMITLTADLLELKANPDRQAKGTVIEASLDKNRGPIATLLVQRGTLRQGDALVVGTMMGNVRAMFNEHHEPIESAGPSVPVEIMGLSEVPQAGDTFYEVEDEKLARSLVERRQAEEREKELSRTNKLSLENLFEQMGKGEMKDLNIILKADVQGSIQALATSLEKLSNDEVTVKIIHSAVGSITASDIRLADVSDAIIIGFNVRPTNQVTDLAKESNVQIRLYSVIYEAIDDVKKALTGMLEPVFEEEVLGHAEIRETYKVSGVGTVAGAYVTDGSLRRNVQVRVVRDGVVLHEGKLASLRRFQDDVKEVQQGYECGFSVERYNDLLVGDVIEAFHMKEIKPKLESK
ncbi:MAG: translation initiation factor IF-2 [Eubacteriales bacterium]|nr:translation initiation factor IF-2 [Clostridiales bacterium]MDY5835590.1 translation initiation factor IF-2 [Eubacteriales bacterium]